MSLILNDGTILTLGKPGVTSEEEFTTPDAFADFLEKQLQASVNLNGPEGTIIVGLQQMEVQLVIAALRRM